MADIQDGSTAAALSLAIMLGGLVLISIAAMVEHYTGRPNPIMKLLDWLWRD